MESHPIATNHENGGEFAYLWGELSRRTKEFPKRAVLVFYVLGAVAGLGGLGIWTELVRMLLSENHYGWDRVFTATAAFYPAVIGSAAFRLQLVATGKPDQIISAFGLLVLLFAFGTAVFLAFFGVDHPGPSLVAAIVLALFAIWIWIVANVDDPIYKSIPVDTASGGNPSRDPKGDFSEFKAD